MALVPDCCFMDAQYELVSDTGAIKHAALTLYGYYCKLRNKETGLCFPKTVKTAAALGMPRTNVIMLTKFLVQRAWIQVYSTGTIRPLKGFCSDDERFFAWLKNFLQEDKNALLIRQVCLINRQICLLIRTLFKGTLNQPIEPAHLTSSSAESAKPKSANAPGDQKIDKSPPAGKPTTAAPASPGKPAPRSSAGKPADNRINHPAVKLVKEITGRNPPKDQWDKLIRELPAEPDTEFFRAAWEIWRSFDGNPTNLQGWLFQPNERKRLPEVFAREPSKNGNHGSAESPPAIAPEPEPAGEQVEPTPLDERVLKAHLFDFRAMAYRDDELRDYEQNYTPDDWAWLMKELRK